MSSLHKIHGILALAPVFSLAAISSAQTITSFTPSSPTRSGLVRIHGSGFGNNGSILLWGRPAHIARWEDTYIEMYIPEETPLGAVKGVLNVAMGRKTPLPLNIQPRTQMSGRFKWRFQAVDQYILNRPAVGPDGTLYALGNFGHLYALTPDGGLKWVRTPSGGVAGVASVGQDGTIYTGGSGGVQAFSPEGDLKWTYSLNSTILAGPSVGPDGRIYAVDNSRWNPNPSGAVILNPNGQQIWKGGVFYERGGAHSTEIQFDSTNAYVWGAGDTTTGALGGLHAIQLGGGLSWRNPDIVGFQPAGYPGGGVAAVGTSSVQRMDSAGSSVWSVSLWDFGGSQPNSDVGVGPDGSTYLLTKNTRINAINANGSIRFSMPLGGLVSELGVSPSGHILLVQKSANFGQPFHLEAYAPSGSKLWVSENLPVESGQSIAIFERIAFSADSTYAYFGTSGPMTGTTTAYCYVYGMDLH